MIEEEMSKTTVSSGEKRADSYCWVIIEEDGSYRLEFGP